MKSVDGPEVMGHLASEEFKLEKRPNVSEYRWDLEMKNRAKN